jgi:hypothetical protein
MSDVPKVDRSIPGNLREQYDNLERQGFLQLYLENYAASAEHFKLQYAMLLRAQTESHRAISKGALFTT